MARSAEQELKILLEAEEIHRCREDCTYFINNYVRIEDRDAALKLGSASDGIAAPFTLWDGQKEALNAFLENRLVIVLKARQLGLSWLALAYAVWRILFFPGYQVVVLSKREDDAKELIRRIKFILKYLPDFMVQELQKHNKKSKYAPLWTSTTMSVTIKRHDKEPSVFRSMSSSADSGRSFTANLLLLDEWAFQSWAHEIWASVYPTINRPSGGQVIGISTAKINTLFEEIWRDAVAGENQFKPIFLPWWTDPRRTQEWYEETKKNLPHSYMQEYPATPEDAFSFGEMTAFPEFSQEIHVCKPFSIPKHWRRWRSVDNGYDDPFAWYWFAVSEDGKVYVYREYTRDKDDKKVTYSEQARKVKELSTYAEIIGGEETEVEEDIDFTVAGHDAWFKHHRDISGKCLIDYYEEGGLRNFIKAVTNRRLRKSVLHEYLKPYYDENTGRLTAKLQIFENCRKLIETLPLLPKDEHDPERVADCSIDHWYDALGYGLIAYHSENSSAIRQEKSELVKHKEKMARLHRIRAKRGLF